MNRHGTGPAVRALARSAAVLLLACAPFLAARAACERLPGAVACPVVADERWVRGPGAVVDPAEYLRSDLSFTDRERLEAAAVADIERLLDRFERERTLGAPPEVRVTGFAVPEMARMTAERLADALRRHDVERLLHDLRLYLIPATYTRSADGAIVFESRFEASAGNRLRRALHEDDLASLEAVLADGAPSLDSYLPGRERITPLLHAIELGRVEAVRRLLDAGADPDAPVGPILRTPLQAALDAGDETVAGLLAGAGANLDRFVMGARGSRPPLAHALADGATDRAVLLLELGADPDAADHAGWTPLMDAVFAERLELVDALLPVADPRPVSTDEITRRHHSKDLGVRYMPRTNALHLATRMSSPRGPEIADAIRARAAALDPDAGATLVGMVAARSAADAAAFEGRSARAAAELRDGLALVDIGSIDGATNGELIVLAMSMLTELHELLLVSGDEPSAAERADVRHLIDLGGWHAPLHDMLDAIGAARVEYPAGRLRAWSAAHGVPDREDWSFERLNAWVESIGDADVRDRLFDTLDFFEMEGWTR